MFIVYFRDLTPDAVFELINQCSVDGDVRGVSFPSITNIRYTVCSIFCSLKYCWHFSNILLPLLLFVYYFLFLSADILSLFIFRKELTINSMPMGGATIVSGGTNSPTFQKWVVQGVQTAAQGGTRQVFLRRFSLAVRLQRP